MISFLNKLKLSLEITIDINKNYVKFTSGLKKTHFVFNSYYALYKTINN